MDLVHQFTIPAPAEQAWEALSDVPGMARCLPGAKLDEGSADPFTGAVTVKVGAMTIRFRGEAEFSEFEPTTHRMALQLSGKDVRGASSAAATIAMRLEPAGAQQTKVHVTTALDLKGKVAQFGRGVMQDVSDALLGEFVRNLETQLAASANEPAAAAAGSPAADGAAASPSIDRAPTGSGHDDVLDLGGAALPVLTRRYATPAVAGLALLTAVVALARTFRRRDHLDRVFDTQRNS